MGYINSEERKHNVTRRKIIFSAASLAVCALLCLTLYYSDIAADAAKEGLILASSAVVPALFAFSVLARILCEIGFPDFVIKTVPIHKLFGLPECTFPVIVCGFVGGFPVGAMLTADLYSRGRLTRGEAARLCAISSNVSPAFLVGVVGKMFSSSEYGLKLWFVQSAVVICAGAVMRYLPDDSSGKKENINKKEHFSVIRTVCSAVAVSAAACVTVTGYIVFFRVISAVVGAEVPRFYGVLRLVCEFSGGAEYAAELSSRAACGFAVGFGGISALMQVANYAEKEGIPMFATVVVRVVCAGVLALVH